MALLTCDFFSDDHTAWLRYTSIERYATARGLAVVMPAVDRSFYANEKHGHRYWDYVSDELPQVVERFFRPGVHEWGLWDAQIQDVLDWMVAR